MTTPNYPRWWICIVGLFLLFSSVPKLFAGTPPIDIIVNNQDTNGTVQINGNWVRPNNTQGQPDYWLDDNNAHGGNSIVFTPNLPESGVYQVYTTWITNSARTPNATNATYTVTYTGGSQTVVAEDQSQGTWANTGAWYELGTFQFDAGKNGSVTLSDTNTNGYVVALSVRFVKDRTTVVDYSTVIGPVTHRATGVLASFSANTPVPNLVNPLLIHMFRTDTLPANSGTGATPNYNRMKSIVSQNHGYIQCNLSDGYGNGTGQYGYPGESGDPNFVHWNAYVTSTVQLAVGAGCTFQWDIWNEPNSNNWPQTDIPNYYLAWQNAYNIIRTLQPGADITGPCTGWQTASDLTWLENFLTWANAQNPKCLPDVITWHPAGTSGASTAVVANQVATLKQWLSANGISINRFSTNENIGPAVEANAGVAVWAMDDLERAQIESAAHASWHDPDGTNEFSNNSLDGLLTNAQGQRGTWWSYKLYGDITGQLVSVTNTTGSVRGVAGYDTSTQQFHMVFGRGYGIEQAARSDTVQVNVTNMTAPGFFTEGETVTVQGYQVPNVFDQANGQQWAALPSGPLLQVSHQAVITNGQITVWLPQFGPSDSYSVIISK